MSSELKSNFIKLIVVGAILTLIRYLAGSDDVNNSPMYQGFIGVFKLLWWVVRYLLIPFIILGLILMRIDEYKKKKKR